MRSEYLYRVMTLCTMAGVTFLGWSVTNAQQSTTEQQRESMTERTQRGAEQMGESAERAGERMNREAQRAGERMRGEERTGQQGMATAPQLPKGVEQANLNSGEALRDVLSTLTESALTRGSLDDVIDQFAESDRKRLEQAGGMDQAQQQLDATIDRFKQQWQAKYNQGFDIKDEDQVYGQQYLSIAEGKIQDPNALSTWPVQPTGKGPEATMGQPQRSEQIKQGEQIAVVKYTPSAGQASFTASFVHEKPDFWKIDIPDNINTQQLVSHLTSHINEVTSMSNQWPADPQDAYRSVTHHILQACYGVGTKGGQSGQQGMSSQPGMSDHQGMSESQSGQSGKSY